jgi:hypothetical protein
LILLNVVLAANHPLAAVAFRAECERGASHPYLPKKIVPDNDPPLARANG